MTGDVEPVVVIHAGAGARTCELVEHEADCRRALLQALADARAVLEAGGGAIDAVQAAIMAMEGFELFNAGRGSALCSDGSVEMSAALMHGPDRAAGAVAAIRHTRHPIIAARSVLTSRQVLMVGDAADAWAAREGAEQRPNSHFITERQRRRLRQAVGGGHATVGAVCLDAGGGLAAGTSTGGVGGQPPGRVGDSPIIGAGTWADRHAAISCTGDGEAFIRCGTSRTVAARVERGMGLQEAGREGLAEIGELEMSGGLIAVDRGGRATMPYLTEAMPRGIWRWGDDATVWVATAERVTK